MDIFTRIYEEIKSKGGEPLTFSATGTEEEEMETEKITKACEEIFSSFEKAVTSGDELTLINYLTLLTESGCKFVSDILEKSESKMNGEAAVDVFTDQVWMPLAQLAFGIGFTLGSLGESTSPIIEQRMEEVRATIKEAAFLSYVPRQLNGAKL
jgi:hypothetical protein